MAHIIVIFISPSNHWITKMIEKWFNFHVPSPLSVKVDWKERDDQFKWIRV